MRQARDGSEVAELLLDYRRAVKASEYLRSWVSSCDQDWEIHPTYHAGRVLTGRLSCEGPNLQQVTKVLKPAFIPRPGYLLAELDYSQIEMRAAAFIARCQPMLEAFQRGDDLHRLLAAKITGKDPADVTPVERQAGKAGNFGFLFGMGPSGFQEYAELNYGVVFTEAQATEVRRAFFDQWLGIEAWHARAVARAHYTERVVSPLGRVRRLPMIHDGNQGLAAHAERQAINSPVQSFASDVMMLAAASIEGTLPGSVAVPGARIVATVRLTTGRGRPGGACDA
jgi:DNA polymerase I-like protein with 3'-5' exonuclease and polymerase domains